MKNESPTISPDAYLTSTEAGRLLQVNPSSVKKWIAQGLLHAYRTPGGHRRVKAQDLAEFMKAHALPVPTPLRRMLRRRLLIIDDEPQQLRAYERELERHADRVEFLLVDNGIDALLQVGRFRPNLIVLDVFMPEVDGIEVCQRLKAAPESNDIYVVVASARMDESVHRRALAAGADLCVSKPLDLEMLLGELPAMAEG